VFGSLAAFIIAYRFYGRFISHRIFGADRTRTVPSEELRDDVDYVPTNKEVLFGHHFASIAGTGPIVGPAIAVIWGWLPALAWILVGSIFAGAVHDYGALIISARQKGRSIGEVSKRLINKRVERLFFGVILFSLWIVVAIFGMVMAVIFDMYPQSVISVWIQIPLAVTVGYLAFKKGFNITVLSIVSVVILYLSVIAGVSFPIKMPAVAGLSPMSLWIIILFVYAFIASVLPVWSLLQPRDYVNSHQLVIGIGLIVAGVLAARPVMVAPPVQLAPEGAPPVLPFLFITVACGAISGFHSLVSSGTSSKQLKSEEDVQFVGYGGMITEGFLGVLVLVAVGAGIGMGGTAGDAFGREAWNAHYASWTAAQGLASKVTAFVDGSANMLRSIGIPLKYGQAVMGVLIASFAGTTLDTATRIQRYVVNEIASDRGFRPLQGRYISTFLVVAAAAALAFAQGGGKGALMLWPVFGTSNQLLAGLVLLVTTLYLLKTRKPVWITLVPMIFMVIISSWGMVYNILDFTGKGQLHLSGVSILLLMFEIWMIVESILVVRKGSIERARRKNAYAKADQ
jgi:carbon starvation protein